MRSRNIVITEKGHAVCTTEPLENRAPAHGEILVENEASLISAGTELSRVYGIKKGLTYPIYPGYASIGRVVRAGGGLAGIREGDRVMFNGAHKSLQFFSMGNRNLELVMKVSEDLPATSSSLLYLGAIAMNGVWACDIKLGERVCVFGLGTVGLLAGILCRMAGAEVLGIDPVENRCKRAEAAGLAHTLVASSAEQVPLARAFWSNAKGADICIDASGHPAAIQNAVDAVAENGQVVLLGSPRSKCVCDITPMLNAIHMKMLTVTGAFNALYPYEKKEGSRLFAHRYLKSFESYLARGSIDADAIISHRIAAGDIMQAYDGLMHKPETYHCVVIDWTKS